MTMKFRIVKNAIRDTLGNASAGNFQVIGFQRQQKQAEAYQGNDRLVEVFFKRESFDLGKGRLTGPTAGDVSISVELTTSSPAQADLSVLDNQASTPVQKQAALAALKEAASIADESFDELADFVYQILMDARNVYFGLGKGIVNKRWVSEITKDNPNERGQLVVLTGILEITCRVSEDVPGDTGKVFDSISLETEIKDDTVQKTGIIV